MKLKILYRNIRTWINLSPFLLSFFSTMAHAMCRSPFSLRAVVQRALCWRLLRLGASQMASAGPLPRLAAGCAVFRLWGFAGPPGLAMWGVCVWGVCYSKVRPPQADAVENWRHRLRAKVLGGEECEGLAGLHQGVNGYLRGCSQAPALPCISWLFSVPKKN